MVVVTVEIWPKGERFLKRHLGTAKISNDVSGTKSRGNYKVTLSVRGNPTRIWKRGRVKDFPRKRLGAWDLLYRALDATVRSRNK